jgi:predicted nucleotidyltransferase component of viral defense system
MSELYLEILDPERKKVWEKLSAFKKYGILAGGTALAFQLGHRKSFDFDLFLPKSLSRQFFRRVLDVFGKNIITRVSTEDILLIKTPKNIEIHFVYVWYINLYPTINTDSLRLFSVPDIAADKAFTIGKRGQWRDYVDIFFLLKKKLFTLEKIIELAQKKYRPEFNPRLFLEQLSYYDDINNFKIEFLKESYPTSQIQSFLTQAVKNFSFK